MVFRIHISIIKIKVLKSIFNKLNSYLILGLYVHIIISEDETILLGFVVFRGVGATLYAVRGKTNTAISSRHQILLLKLQFSRTCRTKLINTLCYFVFALLVHFC